MDEQDRLAEFHRVISEQLNARLAESPRFFWALVVVSTGYGYVLWNDASGPNVSELQKYIVVTMASVLVFATILWASWYLAALGYAFRFLQNSQHCVEHALKWNAYAPDVSPPPPPSARHAFWLLPGIYHAHVFGLHTLLAIVLVTSTWRWWPNCLAVFVHCICLVLGIGFIFWINLYYLRKFRGRWKDPSAIAVLTDGSGL